MGDRGMKRAAALAYGAGRMRRRRWMAVVSGGLLAIGSLTARASSARLNIHVLNDRLTLAVARHPQVYLYGRIDADAPRRFEKLMKSGRIAPGSDVYLDAREGEADAGMALGRLIRQGGMATHLSAPRKTFPHAGASRTAECVDACAYAFFGGLYRWAPSGSDRLGLTLPKGATPALPVAVRGYLAQMQVDLGDLAPAPGTSPGPVLWLSAERLEKSGATNNGRLPPTASYDILSATPTLDLRQVDRKGEHRLTVTCRPGQTLIAAYERVGALHARQVVARGARSYLELNGHPMLVANDGVSAEGDMLVIRRNFPPSELVDLLFAGSVGAWVDGRSAAFRDGFTLRPWGAYAKLKVFYHACWRAAPWPPRAKVPAR